MEDNIVKIKDGIQLHIIKAENFKTNLMTIFITTPLSRKNITANALIPSVLKRGTKNIQTQDEISKKMEDMYGAEAFCDIDKMGNNQILKFYLESINENYLDNKEEILKESINLLLEIVFNPLVINNKFKEEYVNSEKENLRQIIRAKIDNKDAYSLVRTIEEMYKDNIYSLYKYGYEEDLDSINSENLYNRYNELISSSKIDIFVVGDFDEEKLKYFVMNNENIKALKARNADYFTIKLEDKEKVNSEKFVQDKMDVTQGKLVLGMQINNMLPTEKYSAIVYNMILGGSANSKLFQNVREKAHLAYSARSNYSKAKSDIYVRCGIEIDNYEKALKIIREQLKDMENGNFTDEDIVEAKKYMISTINGFKDELESGMMYYFGQELSEDKCSLQEYKEKIEAVTKEQIVNIAKKIQINTVYFLRN